MLRESLQIEASQEKAENVAPAQRHIWGTARLSCPAWTNPLPRLDAPAREPANDYFRDTVHLSHPESLFSLPAEPAGRWQHGRAQRDNRE